MTWRSATVFVSVCFVSQPANEFLWIGNERERFTQGSVRIRKRMSKSVQTQVVVRSFGRTERFVETLSG